MKKKTTKTPKKERSSTEIPFNQYFDIQVRKGIFVAEQRNELETFFQRQNLRPTENIEIFDSALKNY